MVIFASEDVGNADPTALSVALSAKEAAHFVGLPEAALNLSQAVTYLATAPKSNASYRALSGAQRAAREHGSLPVPLSLRNAPTGLMRNLGYGRDYEYPHDDPDAVVPAEYLPDELAGTVFYRPTDRGYEKTIRDRLTRWREIRRGKAKKRRGGT
jgi:putative ATPase